MKRTLAYTLLAVLCAFIGFFPNAYSLNPEHIRIIDYPGADTTRLTGINDDGTMVGSYIISDEKWYYPEGHFLYGGWEYGPTHGFILEKGKLSTLYFPPDYLPNFIGQPFEITPEAINNFNIIVGDLWSEPTSNQFGPFVLDYTNDILLENGLGNETGTGDINT